MPLCRRYRYLLFFITPFMPSRHCRFTLYLCADYARAFSMMMMTIWMSRCRQEDGWRWLYHAYHAAIGSVDLRHAASPRRRHADHAFAIILTAVFVDDYFHAVTIRRIRLITTTVAIEITFHERKKITSILLIMMIIITDYLSIGWMEMTVFADCFPFDDDLFDDDLFNYRLDADFHDDLLMILHFNLMDILFFSFHHDWERDWIWRWRMMEWDEWMNGFHDGEWMEFFLLIHDFHYYYFHGFGIIIIIIITGWWFIQELFATGSIIEWSCLLFLPSRVVMHVLSHSRHWPPLNFLLPFPTACFALSFIDQSAAADFQ